MSTEVIRRRFFADAISEKELRELSRLGKVHQLSQNPYLQICVLEDYDAFTFRCIINHQEDYLKRSNSSWHTIRRNETHFNYYKEYLDGNPQYFTPDGISYYKIISSRLTTVDNIIEFTLELVRKIPTSHFGTLFMVMPFKDEKMDAFYQANVKQFLKMNVNIEAKRADDFTGNDVIVDTIYRELENSEFILCEITNNNKNVFYEIGYARAKNKELILMLQKGKKSEFFDIDHIRRIEYSVSEPIPFQERLKDDILSIRGKR